MKTKQYEYIHRNKFITIEAESIDDFIEIFEHHAELFKAWKQAGIVYSHSAEDDYATFIAPNKELADEWGFEEVIQCDYDKCEGNNSCEDCPYEF